MSGRVRTVVGCLGLVRPARALRRRFLPAHARADLRDQRQLARLLDDLLEPDSDCVDVGAHSGAVLIEILARAPHGRHTAFEPLPELAAGLRRAFPRVDVHEAALSDRAGGRPFFRVVESPAWSGFRERPAPTPGPTEPLDVRVERLDDALDPAVSPALVKIDVEGAELEVLEGGRETLRRHRPVVVFEHGAGSADHYDTTPADVFDLLSGLGYEIVGLDGDGPYDRSAFEGFFRSGERVNFAARPTDQARR